MVTAALGYLVRFVVLPDQAYELAGKSDMLAGLPFEPLIGGKGLDADQQSSMSRDAGRQ